MVNDWLKLVVNGTDSDLAKSEKAFEIATMGNTKWLFLSHEPLDVTFSFSFSFHYLIILGLLALLTD